MMMSGGGGLGMFDRDIVAIDGDMIPVDKHIHQNFIRVLSYMRDDFNELELK